MKTQKPSQSKTQMKQTMPQQVNLFPMSAIKNQKSSLIPNAKQAIGATKQPNIASPQKATSKIDGQDYSGKPGSKNYKT